MYKTRNATTRHAAHILNGQNTFISLPRELILAICEELDLNDLKHMRLTSKTLANDAAPLVLSHLTISADRAKTIRKLVSDLQFITKPERAAVKCSREITFGDFSAVFPQSDKRDGRMLRIGAEFFRALTSFKAVRTVNWNTGDDPNWLQEIIWKAINEFPNLRHLKMHALFLKHPLGNFDSLNALESINISSEHVENNGALFLSLSKLYASSTSLNSITVENPYGSCIPAHNLQQLFSSSSGGHRLHRLALCNVSFRLDNASLSHLIHLKSFKLSSLPHSLTDESLSSSPDEIWIAFKRSKIRLEELEVGYDVMADSLNEYLSSFSGLKKLELTIEYTASSEACAVKFWSEGFSNHVDTIQDLSLCSSYDGKWCFGPHNRSLIERCIKLKQLTINLSLPSWQTADSNDINDLMDTVVTCMPQMRRLELLFRGYVGVLYKILDCILEYRPPASCQRLPQLTAHHGSRSVTVFVGVEGAWGSQLRYFQSVQKFS